MKSYIFITDEGVTYQPDSNSPEPDIENCQVIAFVKGKNENEAFENLIQENGYLLDTNFNKTISIELKNVNYQNKYKYFYLNDHKNKKCSLLNL